MKYLNAAIVSIIILITISGCSDFLSETPTAHQSTSNYYKTSSEARKAINQVYHAAARIGFGKGAYSKVTFGDIMSDDAAKGGGGISDQAGKERLKLFEAKPSNIYAENAWKYNFRGVYLSNLVLSKVQGINMNSQQKKEILAEAHFFRGYFYLQLVRLFGNVPLIKKPLNKNEYDQPQVKANEIWSFIEQEEDSAIINLPTKSELSTDSLGRATKAAAQSLLLNAYMWQKKWREAEKLGDQIINSGRYSLALNYNKIWALDGEFGPGSIFELNFEYIPGIPGISNNYSQYEVSRSKWGIGFVCPTQDLVNAFEKDDPRLKATVIFNDEQLPNGNRGNTTLSPTGYLSRKYWLPKYYPRGPVNERVYRLAVIMLWDAEASVHNGNIPNATELVNKVRARARKSGGNTNTSVLPPYSSVTLENVYHEERVEQALGAHRRFYNLVRTGRAADILSGYKEGVSNHIPIPLREIQLSDGILKQNNGY